MYTCTCIRCSTFTLMSFEGGDKLEALILQSQHTDLTTVVSYEDVTAAPIIRDVRTPRLGFKTAELTAGFRAAPLECLVSRDAQDPLHVRDELQSCDSVAMDCVCVCTYVYITSFTLVYNECTQAFTKELVTNYTCVYLTHTYMYM